MASELELQLVESLNEVCQGDRRKQLVQEETIGEGPKTKGKLEYPLAI